MKPEHALDRPRILEGFSRNKAPEAELGARSVDELDQKIRHGVSANAKTVAQGMLLENSVCELPSDLLRRTGTIGLMMDYWRSYNEASDSYLLASALITVAVAAGKDTYLEDGDSRLYPNLWLLMPGKSSTKKSTAAGLPFGLARSVGLVPFTFPRCTAEGLFLLAAGHRDKDGKLLVKQQTYGAWKVDEYADFAAYLGRDYNSSLKPSLMSAFDGGVVDLMSSSKGRQEALFEGISIVAASTPDLLKLTKEDFYSGWLGRWLLWPAFKKSGRCYPIQRNRGKALLGEIGERLRTLRQGQVLDFDPSGEEEYCSWYRQDIDTEPPEILGSSWIRHQTYVKKLAAIATLSEGSTSIGRSEVRWAIDLIQWQRANLLVVAQRETSSVFAKRQKDLLDFLVKRDGSATRREVLRAMCLKMTDLEDVIEYLKEAGLIGVAARENEGTGRSVVYVLTDNHDSQTL